MSAIVDPYTLIEHPDSSSIRDRARPRVPIARARMRRSADFSRFPVVNLMSRTPEVGVVLEEAHRSLRRESPADRHHDVAGLHGADRVGVRAGDPDLAFLGVDV